MAKMRRSGYDERMRKRILVAGVLGYTRMDKNVEEGISRINRPRWVGAVERRYKKIGGKSSWFKGKRRKVGGGTRKGGNTKKRGKE